LQYPIIKTLQQCDLSLDQPIDCLIDFSRNEMNINSIPRKKCPNLFTMGGDRQSKRTARHFLHISNPTLSDFLTSLGIDDTE